MCDPTAYCRNISKMIKKEKLDESKEILLQQPQKRIYVRPDGVVLKQLKLIKTAPKPVEPVHRYDSEVMMYSPTPLSPITIIDDTQNTDEMIDEMFRNSEADIFNIQFTQKNMLVPNQEANKENFPEIEVNDSQDTQFLFEKMMAQKKTTAMENENLNKENLPVTEEVQIMMDQRQKKSCGSGIALKRLKLIPSKANLEPVHRPQSPATSKQVPQRNANVEATSSSCQTIAKQISYASQLTNPEMKFIATQLAALRLDIAKNNNLIRNVLLDVGKFQIKLPLDDITAVNELNRKIEADENEVFINNLWKFWDVKKKLSSVYIMNVEGCLH